MISGKVDHKNSVREELTRVERMDQGGDKEDQEGDKEDQEGDKRLEDGDDGSLDHPNPDAPVDYFGINQSINQSTFGLSGGERKQWNENGIILVVQGQQIPADRGSLATVSKFFRALFKHKFRDSTEPVLCLDASGEMGLTVQAVKVKDPLISRHGTDSK